MPFFNQFANTQLEIVQEQNSSVSSQLVPIKQLRKNNTPAQNKRNMNLSIPSPNFGNYGFPIRFSTTLGQSQLGDPSLLWSLNPPNPYQPNLDMGIFFQKQNIVMTNITITQTYPINIYLSIDNFPGYINTNGVATGNVLKFGLKNVIYVQTNPVTLTLLYQADETRWILSRFTNTLNFRMYFDDNTTPVLTPLPFEFGLQMSITKTPWDKNYVINENIRTTDIQFCDEQINDWKFGVIQKLRFMS